MIIIIGLIVGALCGLSVGVLYRANRYFVNNDRAYIPIILIFGLSIMCIILYVMLAVRLL